MDCVKVTKKGQVTIPLRFRQLLKIKAGERVVFDLEEGKVIIKRASENPVTDLTGLGKGVFIESLEYQRKIRAEWEKDEDLP